MEDKENSQSIIFGIQNSTKKSNLFLVQLLIGNSDGNIQSCTAC